MRKLGLTLGALLVWFGITTTAHRVQDTVGAPPVIRFPNANSRQTYFTIHNIWEAWEISRGEGVRVGILDHSFGYDEHEGLYAGGENFQTDEWGTYFGSESHHGFWMAATLREVAPQVEIYALGTYSSDEYAKVGAMIRAIDWAIKHDLDVLTYSAARISTENRPRLDAAVDRALEHGIVTTFIHYPHPGNLLPTWLGPRSGDDEREPDVNILHYDYQLIFTERYLNWLERGSDSGYRPYLSISSTSPVTAGFVAMLKSVQPNLQPADYKQILMQTSRSLTFEGQHAPRVVDIAAALRRVQP
ncbi:MAG: S8/S53 family peptidase [Gemmatimonadota bacterium]|nr:MAG: S8/S53 family peptidase [Gemmatimonadota bacterium]